MSTPGLLALNSILARAQANVDAKAKLDDAKAKVKKARTVEARTEAEAEAESLTAALEWRTEALVLQFTPWRCACCSLKGARPDGLFLFQTHTRLANAWRLTRPRHESDVGQDVLRRQWRYAPQEVVLMCPRCKGLNGFTSEWQPPAPRRIVTPASSGNGPFVTEWRQLTARLSDDQLKETP